jgi:hypothetical protein
MTEIGADIHPIYEQSLCCPVLRVKWRCEGLFRLLIAKNPSEILSAVGAKCAFASHGLLRCRLRLYVTSAH